jgi:hypothetical protein
MKISYRGPAETVIVTGSFDSWSASLKMRKKTDGSFEVDAPMDDRKTTFKFIVDGVWTCGTGYPTEFDQEGNLNCYIEAESRAIRPAPETVVIKPATKTPSPRFKSLSVNMPIKVIKPVTSEVLKQDSTATLVPAEQTSVELTRKSSRSSVKKALRRLSNPFTSQPVSKSVKTEVSTQADEPDVPARKTGGIWSKLKKMGGKN